jgi:putative heme-binding domain-containing protein
MWIAALGCVLAQSVSFEPGDRVCVIGNTLADRLQHDGWLDTMLHSRFPEHDLVVRHLGFSGDELKLRLRSADFGTPDEHLARLKADVVLAFFGYNESFADPDAFRRDLGEFIDHTRAQRYNGKSAPRLVLFSPVAHENLRSPNLPDGAANNARLERCTRAMAEVARARGVPFVDLFHPSLKLYADAPRPLTINGVHLNEEGNRAIAQVIDAALGADPAPVRATDYLARLNGAVRERNFFGFNRYRVTDGYSTYGGRADLKFVDGQTNREVLQRELEVLDVMTANRDRRVWAAARGRELAIDDANTPPFIPVKTNKPGPGPDGAHVFLGGEEAIGKMQIAKGLKVNLVASEERFPELVNPVQMAFDTKGRLWVAAWPSYPHWRPKEEMNDKLLILEDADGDGRADRVKTFADRLHNPTGFEFWGGGVIVAMAPDLLFLKDTDGDDRADVRARILGGLDSADTHHAANSFVLDPGGALYFQEGTFHHTQVETPWGPPERCANAGVFRFEPRTFKFGVYVSYPFANPHGHVFDRWGQDFVTDGTTEETYYAISYSGRVEFPRKHGKPPLVFAPRTRPCPATEILSSRHFPPEAQGHLLVANVIGVLGILQYRLSDRGSGFEGTEVEPILLSSDQNFRPSDLEMGPDGALYFVDWQNPIIGHMQHNLRDPSRDRTHGRVYRVTVDGRPLSKPPPIAGQPIERLLDALKEPEDRVRYRARIELSGRPTAEVIAAARRWSSGLDPKDSEFEHHRLEALWLHQSHNVVDEALLGQVLRSPDFRARAAAVRVLRAWRDRVARPLELLAERAADPHPRVRLAAVVAASDWAEPAAAEVALESLRRERDEFIDFALRETMATLEPYWKPALSQGKLRVAPDNPAAAEFLLGKASAAELAGLPRTPAVLLAMATRPGVPVEARRDAVGELARQRGADPTTVLLDLIVGVEGGGHAVHELGSILAARPADELRRAGDRLRTTAREGPTPEARQAAIGAWITLEGSAEPAWAALGRTPGGARDLLDAIPCLAREDLRAGLYPKVRALLADARSVDAAEPLRVDYFEAQVESVPIETLAKLQPVASGPADSFSLDLPLIRRRDAFALRFTGSLQVPRDGRYTFFSNSDDGSRVYIDGKLVVNNDGWHGMVEKSGRIDLKAGAHPIVVTYFDQGGDDGLVVSWQGPGVKKQPIPASALGPGAAGTVADAAIRALESIPGRDAEKFADLAALVRGGKAPAGAFRVLRSIDPKFRAADQARPLINAILSYASALAPAQRTTPQALDALRLGQELASLLPGEEAARAAAMLKNLDVAIIVIRPVPHQMLFDRREIVVEAGKPVEIVFENVDIMPHNLVITAPGAMAQVGELAEKMGPEGPAKHYVPDTPKVLWATKLLLPGQAERLQFTAPAAPGAHPYVCTFPGHWLVMNGVMRVVAKGAASSLGEAPAAPSRPFVKMWTMEDLEADAARPAAGRSFERGKAMFAAAGCAKCHVIAGEGAKIGPDITKTAEKYRGRELLRQILDPSVVIDDAYKVQIVQLDDESVVMGAVVSEDAAELRLRPDPLKPDDVTSVPKARIASRRASPISTMPTGLLVTLSREEILDLLAYVESGANPNAAVFK